MEEAEDGRGTGRRKGSGGKKGLYVKRIETGGYGEWRREERKKAERSLWKSGG